MHGRLRELSVTSLDFSNSYVYRSTPDTTGTAASKPSAGNYERVWRAGTGNRRARANRSVRVPSPRVPLLLRGGRYLLTYLLTRARESGSSIVVLINDLLEVIIVVAVIAAGAGRGHGRCWRGGAPARHRCGRRQRCCDERGCRRGERDGRRRGRGPRPISVHVQYCASVSSFGEGSIKPRVRTEPSMTL